MPDRSTVTMQRHFLSSYVDLLIATCHRRRAHAMGGQWARDMKVEILQIPSKFPQSRACCCEAALPRVPVAKQPGLRKRLYTEMLFTRRLGLRAVTMGTNGSPTLQPSGQVSESPFFDRRLVAVGTPVTRRPPHRSVRAHFSAYGSYLGCLASNRTPGSGCRIRTEGR